MIKGGLFTRYFLEDGIRVTAEYKAITPVILSSFTQTARIHWYKLAAMPEVNEAVTTSELINPIIAFLGWSNLPQQKTGKDGKDVPDALLFTSESIKEQASALPTVQRFSLGTIVVEHESRDTKLGLGTAIKETPAGQILRYLSRADIASNGAIRWGLLTNGRYWRLYDHRAPARSEGFCEFDLSELLATDPPNEDREHWLRVFLLLFGVESFILASVANSNFIQFVLAEGKKYEQRITAALSGIVFGQVFPSLIAAIGKQATPEQCADPIWRAYAREAGLKLLFRLLFLLYAEDRDLLPVRHEGYEPYSLRSLREEAAKIADEKKTLSPKQKTWSGKLTTLFSAIATGDDSMGLPPYNGGLFDEKIEHSFGTITLPDAALAPLIENMSREGLSGARRWINYRDLSVQQLGSIYEQLLEQDVIDTPAGLSLRANPFSRKTTGSYYTPDELVQLILRRAILPLLSERQDRFRAKVEELAKDKRPKAERLKILSSLDAASAFVSLRIIDPAMGSGHFLVSLVDYLADKVLDELAAAPVTVSWAGVDKPYRSPLADQILQLRAQLQTRAEAAGWPVRDDQLDDRHLIRRIILKRVIYGVDLNPMAVELAKLSLWLHSFTVGAPLSFLDHHLRVGDSLFGEFVAPVQAELREEYGFVMTDAVAKAANAAAGMAMVEALTDADITEVKNSAMGFAGVEEATSELRAFLDFYQAKRWLPADSLAQKSAIKAYFGGSYGDPVAIAGGTKPKISADGFGAKKGKVVATAKQIRDAALEFFVNAKILAAERQFLHWEAAFPGVWQKWETSAPEGGFDAVIGNPPWDRMKLQEVEWFAARKPEIAMSQRASDRKKAIAALRKSADPLAKDFARAEAAAEGAARVARESGAYPLLSGGDINIYSLFVERAQRLARSDGIIGLLVPSGIAADLGAAPFFRSISTTGRLSTLFDFENGLGSPASFFPDVHRQFKFSALIFGAEKRKFSLAECAFYQSAAAYAEQNAVNLTALDFENFNPNTGTAPLFRSKGDLEITRRIYERSIILADRRGPEKPIFAWPVRYVTMFHMTNDSDKFITTDELKKNGAYKVKGGIWEKGDERWTPLMVGKSIWIFDHRYASSKINEGALHVSASSELTTESQHADPMYHPIPQYWVASTIIPWPDKLDWAVAFRDITNTRNMRTVIATIIPKAALGNTLPSLWPFDGKAEKYVWFAPLLSANLSSFALDYVARIKIQWTHLNSYVLEQLPVIPPAQYDRKFGTKTAAEIIRDDVLHLTYVSYDMTGFAESQGYTDAPFPWDEEDRLRRRARLDALFFHLYGIEPEDIDYILSTFPIVIREEQQKYGRFRSKDLILGYYAALAAGNPDAEVEG